MREQEAKFEIPRRASNKLPPGSVWRTLPQEFEREIEAWSERRRLRSSARRAMLAHVDRDAERAPAGGREN